MLDHSKSSTTPFAQAHIRLSKPIASLFAILAAILRHSQIPPVLGYLLIFLEDLQLCSFVWRPTHIPGLPWALQYIFNPVALALQLDGAFEILFWMVVADVVSMECLAAYGVLGVGWGDQKVTWPLRTLFILATAMSTVLYVPAMQILLGALTCSHSTDINASLPSCLATSQELHYALASLTCMFLLVGFAVIVSVFFIDGNPKSRNVSAQVANRIGIAYLLFKTSIVIADTYASSSYVSLILVFLWSGVAAVASLWTLPYLQMPTNQLRTGGFLFAFLSALVAICTKPSAGEPNDVASGSLVALCLSVVLGYGLGAYSVKVAIESIRAVSIHRMRHKAQQAQKSQAEAEVAVSVPLGQAGHKGTLSTTAGTIVERITKTFSLGPDDDDDENPTLETAESNVLNHAHAIAKTKDVVVKPVFFCAEHVEISCRFMLTTSNPDALRLMALIFEEGASQYPKSAAVAWSSAKYLRAFGNDSESEDEEIQSMLGKASKFASTVAIKFAVFLSVKVEETAQRLDDVGSSAGNVASSAEYRASEGAVKRIHLEALDTLKRFWVILDNEKPDMDSLTPILERLYFKASQASDMYAKLLARFPNNKQLLRLHGTFLQSVRGDSTGGAALMQCADDLEGKESAAQGKGSSSISKDKRALIFAEEAEDSAEIVDTKIASHRPSNELSRKSSVTSAAAVVDPDGSDDGNMQAKPTGKPRFSDGENPSRLTRKISQSVEQRSETSASSLGRESRKMKILHDQFQNRMSGPSRSLYIQLAIAVAVSIGLLVISYVIATSAFASIDKDFTTNKGFRKARQTIAEVIQETRLMARAFSQNDVISFSKHRDAVIADQLLMKTAVIPSAFLLDATTNGRVFPVARLASANQTEAAVLTYHSYTLYQLVLVCTDAIDAIVDSSFSDYRATYGNDLANDPNVNFFFQNAISLMDALNEGVKSDFTMFIQSLQESTNILWVLFAVQAVVQVVVSSFLYFKSIRNHEERIRKVIKLVGSVPRHAKKAIITNITESIEALSLEESDALDEGPESGPKAVFGDSTAESTGQTIERQQGVAAYKKMFALGAVLVGAASVSIFVPIFIDMSTLQSLSYLSESIGRQRFYLQRVLTMATEVTQQDLTVWNVGEPEMYLRAYITEAADQSDLIRQGRAGVSPGTDDVPELYNVMVAGGTCLLSTGCDNRPYNETIGFTQTLVTGGLEKVQRVYIQKAQDFLYLPATQHTADNDIYQLLYILLKDVTAGLTIAYNTVFNEGILVLQTAGTQATAVFGVGVSVCSLVWCLVYRQIVRNLEGQVSELANIAFSVPKTSITPGSPLARCLETGGLSLEMEEH